VVIAAISSANREAMVSERDGGEAEKRDAAGVIMGKQIRGRERSKASPVNGTVPVLFTPPA